MKIIKKASVGHVARDPTQHMSDIVHGLHEHSEAFEELPHYLHDGPRFAKATLDYWNGRRKWNALLRLSRIHD